MVGRSSSFPFGEGVLQEPGHCGLFVARHNEHIGQARFQCAYLGPALREQLVLPRTGEMFTEEEIGR